eukprot:Gb_24276 [translate_table: standard]
MEQGKGNAQRSEKDKSKYVEEKAFVVENGPFFNPKDPSPRKYQSRWHEAHYPGTPLVYPESMLRWNWGKPSQIKFRSKSAEPSKSRSSPNAGKTTEKSNQPNQKVNNQEWVIVSRKKSTLSLRKPSPKTPKSLPSLAQAPSSKSWPLKSPEYFGRFSIPPSSKPAYNTTSTTGGMAILWNKKMFTSEPNLINKTTGQLIGSSFETTWSKNYLHDRIFCGDFNMIENQIDKKGGISRHLNLKGISPSLTSPIPFKFMSPSGKDKLISLGRIKELAQKSNSQPPNRSCFKLNTSYLQREDFKLHFINWWLSFRKEVKSIISMQRWFLLMRKLKKSVTKIENEAGVTVEEDAQIKHVIFSFSNLLFKTCNQPNRKEEIHAFTSLFRNQTKPSWDSWCNPISIKEFKSIKENSQALITFGVRVGPKRGGMGRVTLAKSILMAIPTYLCSVQFALKLGNSLQNLLDLRNKSWLVTTAKPPCHMPSRNGSGAQLVMDGIQTYGKTTGSQDLLPPLLDYKTFQELRIFMINKGFSRVADILNPKEGRWKAMTILTGEKRRKGIPIPTICPCCTQKEETVNHLTWECPLAKSLWNKI